MARDLEATPFVLQDAVRPDEEGAALDALDLLAVHDLVLDHAEHVAHLFFGVRDEFEGQFELFLELVMRLHVVARHAKDSGAGLDEILVLVAELHRFCGAARGVVLGIKVQNQNLAKVRGVGDLDTAGSVGFKFREGFVDNDRHGTSISQDVVVDKPGERVCYCFWMCPRPQQVILP